MFGTLLFFSFVLPVYRTMFKFLMIHSSIKRIETRSGNDEDKFNLKKIERKCYFNNWNIL